MKQWILVKFLCDRVYFWAIFYSTGCRVLSGLPHIPVTSLVKYPLPGLGATNRLAILKSNLKRTIFLYVLKNMKSKHAGECRRKDE